MQASNLPQITNNDVKSGCIYKKNFILEQEEEADSRASILHTKC